ncbi:MAG: UDP-N-acetylenolpyruvoylglucosamine reductase [Actinobacteria bacterium 69-20]|nr:UDP-N-acetylmuramate dehydrogenase [Actinomycetota bacterium]OJV26682.1 MAG: UDP-N-acetylenolpyruvoylglucosamine reductase [Actinobacteria bacterium 69-20]
MATGPIRLADLTTIGLGGPAPSVSTVRSAAEAAEVIGAADRDRGALVLGGGSNLVVADAGIDLPVVRIGIPGLHVDISGTEKIGYDAALADSGVDALARVGAGENWDDVVEALVADGWAGVETLSGIPGSAGATPVQNVGAYGTEIADLLVDVEMYDRVTGALRTVPAAELGLGYRASVLRGTDLGVVTSIRLRLARTGAPVRYPELARVLGIAVGGVAPATAVRAAVLELRRSKGMVLDPADADARSVGSFFTNPIVDGVALAEVRAAVRRRLGPDARMPEYPAGHGDARTKLSAAWLIERAGFPKGYPLVPGAEPGTGPGADPGLRPARPEARIAVSTKHTLALTNRGGGSTAELIALAREIRDGVRAAFGVSLQAEPVLLGVGLD